MALVDWAELKGLPALLLMNQQIGFNYRTSSVMCVEGSEIGNLNSTGLQTSSGEYGRLSQAIDCKAACGERCKAASRRNRCLRACGTCCARCNCVPPGTYGNRDVCPCYANMKTHGNRLKCP